MQITDKGEQFLIGVQRLRAMASSCPPPASFGMELSICSRDPTEKMELSIADSHTERTELPMTSSPAQLELLPLLPSSQRASAGLNLWGLDFNAQSLRGIDMNQVPSTSGSGEDEDAEEETAMLQRAGSKREHAGKGGDADQEFLAFPEVSSRASDEDESGSARKKLRLSKEQSALLEERFKEHSTLNPKQKSALAKQLNLRPRQVEVWFQNRRARTKSKQTEVDCEMLKRCCESLTEENRRLQKEVAELRALKVGAPCVLSHDFYMPLPAATLTMCPSCERLAPHGTTQSMPTPTASVNSPPLSTKPHYFPLTFPPQSQPSAAC